MTLVAKAENERYVLKIYTDNEPENPRIEFDSLGTMVCWHNNYALGDKHDYGDPRSFMESTAMDIGGMSYERATEVDDVKLQRFVERYVIMLPLYLYDHGGITMNVGGFSDPWDSGQVGWIYVTKAKAREEYGVKRLTKKLLERIDECLKSEVKTYDQYLRGDVYGFILEDKQHTDDDSCWGFFGSDPMDNGMLGHIGSKHKDLIKSLEDVY